MLVSEISAEQMSSCFSFTVEDLIFGLDALFRDESRSRCSLVEEDFFVSEFFGFGDEADLMALKLGLPEPLEVCFGELVPCLGLCFGLE